MQPQKSRFSKFVSGDNVPAIHSSSSVSGFSKVHKINCWINVHDWKIAYKAAKEPANTDLLNKHASYKRGVPWAKMTLDHKYLDVEKRLSKQLHGQHQNKQGSTNYLIFTWNCCYEDTTTEIQEIERFLYSSSIGVLFSICPRHLPFILLPQFMSAWSIHISRRWTHIILFNTCETHLWTRVTIIDQLSSYCTAYMYPFVYWLAIEQASYLMSNGIHLD